MTTTAPGPGYLTANEAVAFLSVKRATLYTYVSRGLVRSVPCPGGRGRYYLREDLERLKARSEAHAGRSGPDSDVERSSSRTFITQMSPEGPRYRGYAVAELVREGISFESVAELLWTGRLPANEAPGWPLSDEDRRDVLTILRRTCDAVALLSLPSAPLDVVRLGLLFWALQPHGTSAEDPGANLSEARALLRLVAALPATCRGPTRALSAARAPTLAESLAIAWPQAGGDSNAPDRVALLDRALTLAADHAVEPPTLAARAAAHAGGSLAACVLAGVEALSGDDHAGVCAELADWIEVLDTTAKVRQFVVERLDQGNPIPGFGRLAGADPRAVILLEAASSFAPAVRRVQHAIALVESARIFGEPGLEVGLVALAAALGLPPGAPAALLAVGRVAGLVAHVLEAEHRH
ncbi:citrate/2-methylcitrate synthase [Polyangium sp. y55x31]|uniref:citrate/2-methylcitrate synthase n=1 Tax=Polyangium sp. y55x31 TaxID=3042688 RepID=UPI002482F111|nr:citrate/2-methylcitrate synthase [Polyangium sp. y55x31]MDI1479846.1 citrate/2-methylcitrate synthase [Polyangium sp. y55x31]